MHLKYYITSLSLSFFLKHLPPLLMYRYIPQCPWSHGQCLKIYPLQQEIKCPNRHHVHICSQTSLLVEVTAYFLSCLSSSFPDPFDHGPCL